jgi:hypothetical protein
MKRAAIILCACAAYCALGVGVRPAQGAWKKVGESQASRFYLRDERPQETDAGTLLAWQKTEFRTDTKEGRKAREEYAADLDAAKGEYAYTLKLYEYDCRRGLSRLRRFADYDSAGLVLYEADEEDLKKTDTGKWKAPTPESADETAMRRVCLTPDHES